MRRIGWPQEQPNWQELVFLVFNRLDNHNPATPTDPKMLAIQAKAEADKGANTDADG